MTKTNTPKSAIHVQPQTSFSSQQAAENGRQWTEDLYQKKNENAAHHYDVTRKNLNFCVDKNGIRKMAADEGRQLMNRYVRRLAELDFRAYKPDAQHQPIGYLDIVISGNTDVMNRLAFGDQTVDYQKNADNSSINRMPEIEQWAKDVYAFACRKFGEKNVVGCEVHLDETTPHIHLNVIPTAVRKDRGADRCLYVNKENPADSISAGQWKNLSKTQRTKYERVAADRGSRERVSYSGCVGENRRERSAFMTNFHTDFFNEVGSKYGLYRGDPRATLSYDEQLDQRHKTSAELESERIARCQELDKKIKQHKDALSDLKIEILVAGRKAKSFTTMIENLEKEKENLQSQIAELKDAAAAGEISQEALKKDVELLTKKLEATVDKLSTRQQQLADTEEKLKELQNDLSAVAEKRDAAKNDFDFFSKQAVTAKNSAVERMGFIAQEIILNRMVNAMAAWFRALPEEAKKSIGDAFVEDFLNNANAVSKTTMHLVFGMVNQAMDIARDSGGGAASPGEGWGRKDDENEREWIRRCLAEAARMCRPGTVRNKKR